ncbi:RNA-directed DNA polymerase [Candidatus Nomurabacteria bacterium]|nr:RNA-directed DNA polymerase [Candidatus Nomurabacteria bacterium]
MNEFDQFIKHGLRVKCYVRYTDDFVIISNNYDYLKQLLAPISLFLKEKLKLELHPSKVSIRKYHQGIDFLGYVALPEHIKLRTKTERRIFTKLKKNVLSYKKEEIGKLRLYSSLQSYLGVLSHANAYKLGQKLQNKFWFWLNE